MTQLSLDTLKERIAILDGDGVIITINKAWRRFQRQNTGPIANAIVGANYRDHCETPRLRKVLKAALNGNGRRFRISYCLDVQTNRRWFQATITTFEQSGCLWAIVSHEDVTELVNSRRSVSDLQSRLMCLQDDERRQIAMELHDSTAQYLVAAGLSLNRLRLFLTGKHAKVIGEEIDRLLDEALSELRTFTYLLHPIALSREGLIAALHQFSRGLTKRSALEVELTLDRAIDRLPLDFQRAILRIVQEAFANAHRHAAATRVELRIAVNEKNLRLLVSDNGRGMPVLSSDNLDAISGVGISGMRTRVAQFGGKIDFPSGPNGTTVVAIFPIRNKQEKSNAQTCPGR